MVSQDTDEQVPGVRFELRLQRADDRGASYSVSLHSQGSDWEGEVDLVLPAGELEFRFASETPPAACESIVRAALRTIYRERERSGFPRRVTRWRPLPSASGAKHE
jgi:hypothetical protein